MGILPAAARPQLRLHLPPARPLAMLPPLPCARMAGIVASGLGSYVRRHAAQLSVLCGGALGLGLLAQHGGLEALGSVAVAEGLPPDWPPEAGLLLLLAGDVARVAACAGLCLATARLLDRRRQRTEDLACLLAQRQAALHRFSADVLDRLLAAGMGDKAGTVAAFQEWYLAQLAASDALLSRLQGGGAAAGQAHDDPAAQLAATLERLGLTAAELAMLASGRLVSGRRRSDSDEEGPGKGGKAQGPSEPLRPRRIHGARQRRDPMHKERALLERLVQRRTRADHHPAFQAYVAEMEAALERCLQEPPEQEAGGCSRAGCDDACGNEGAAQGGDARGQRRSGGGSGSSCSTGDMLAAFDEGDCLESADSPDLAREEGCVGGGGSRDREEE